jgi:hypothetical protein
MLGGTQDSRPIRNFNGFSINCELDHYQLSPFRITLE